MLPAPDALRAGFARAYSSPPEAVVFAPGRVNLIGEHVDYHGLPVLPMAIDRAVALAFRRRPDRLVELHNAEPRFETVRFTIEAPIPPERQGAWGNYPRAAAQALEPPFGPLRGIEGLVASTLPWAAGLSSSSALVVATALALLHGQLQQPDRLDLAERLARGERYVGLQGGGMDQAACLFGRRGHATHIAFRPHLSVTAIAVPSGWRVLVASSLRHAAKSAAAREVYNARVAEGRAALARVAAEQRPGEGPSDYAALLAGIGPRDAMILGERTLEGVGLARYRHIVSEAERVERAVAALQAGDLEGFGRLLTASHASLRDDYAVSTPELDRLVELALAGGAAGARLTGAGLGGSMLAVVSHETADRVADTLWRGFFEPEGVPPADRSMVLFECDPADGAELVELSG